MRNRAIKPTITRRREKCNKPGREAGLVPGFDQKNMSSTEGGTPVKKAIKKSLGKTSLSLETQNANAGKKPRGSLDDGNSGKIAAEKYQKNHQKRSENKGTPKKRGKFASSSYWKNRDVGKNQIEKHATLDIPKINRSSEEKKPACHWKRVPWV